MNAFLQQDSGLMESPLSGWATQGFEVSKPRGGETAEVTRGHEIKHVTAHIPLSAGKALWVFVATLSEGGSSLPHMESQWSVRELPT